MRTKRFEVRSLDLEGTSVDLSEGILRVVLHEAEGEGGDFREGEVSWDLSGLLEDWSEWEVYLGRPIEVRVETVDGREFAATGQIRALGKAVAISGSAEPEGFDKSEFKPD